MLDIDQERTIAAIATPLGVGGVGIVRISGQSSLIIGEKVFCSAREDFKGFRPYVLHHGWIKDQSGQVLDEVLASYMPGPGSYTGENVLEINCHGGPAVVQQVLDLVLAQGAELANPGEFTMRAFLNGRLDLSQAESVAELISAPTRAGTRLASEKLQGALSRRIQDLRSKLEGLRVQLSAAVDFPEEDLEYLPPEELQNVLGQVQEDIAQLLENYSQYAIWREGALVVLAGKVNAGKSSLLNALLGRNRAIVTPIPGTTRDYLEEQINLQGLPLRLVDTAGLRETEDEIERAGLDQGRALVIRADLVCMLVDLTEDRDEEVLNFLNNLPLDKVVLVGSKADLLENGSNSLDWLPKDLNRVQVSAKTGFGLDKLTALMRRMLVGSAFEPETGKLVPNTRQKKSLKQARDELKSLEKELEEGQPYDLLGIGLEKACETLAEITGEISSQEVLDGIFERFCIGK